MSSLLLIQNSRYHTFSGVVCLVKKIRYDHFAVLQEMEGMPAFRILTVQVATQTGGRYFHPKVHYLSQSLKYNRRSYRMKRQDDFINHEYLFEFKAKKTKQKSHLPYRGGTRYMSISPLDGKMRKCLSRGIEQSRIYHVGAQQSTSTSTPILRRITRR